MTGTAIKVEALGKAYLVGHQSTAPERYTALRDVLARNVRGLVRKTRDMMHGRPIIQGDEIEEFWALRDVTFEVKRGETLGIIGRNGAGKSTLLKLLSRITEPTTGRITLNGRLASLLEVGTGFHPELTGRENIFLNGAILGMRGAEIRRKFDEIVAFAAVEQFLDTPVKRYSSGMYVRLAFAVAAHLEPEILVVDEVLAVGDAAFQTKCLGKMGQVANAGRTVIFVSHNLASISKLCRSCLFIDSGVLKEAGETSAIIKSYLSCQTAKDSEDLSLRTDREGSGIAKFTAIELLGPHNERAPRVLTGQSAKVRVLVSTQPETRTVRNVSVSIGIDNLMGVRVWYLATDALTANAGSLGPGDTCVVFNIPRLPLVPGSYTQQPT